MAQVTLDYGGRVPQRTLEKSELYKLVTQAINRFAKVAAYLRQPEIQKLVPQPAKEILDLLDELLDTTHASFLQYTTRSATKIRKVFDNIKPFIFGRTPMKMALEHAKKIFDQAKVDQKVHYSLRWNVW